MKTPILALLVIISLTTSCKKKSTIESEPDSNVISLSPKIIDRIPLTVDNQDAYCADVAVNTETNKIYITTTQPSPKLLILDGSTRQITKIISIADFGHCNVCVNENANTIYVSSNFYDLIHVVDGDNDTILKTINYPSVMSTDPRARILNSNINKI